jgi:rhamnosyltransferase
METTLSRETLVVVVTHNPEIDLLTKNLNAIVRQFRNILIVDNHSTNIQQIEEMVRKIDSSIFIEKLVENTGIAYAQNIGLRMARDKKMEWLLTMDQDSIIPDNLSTKYQDIINTHDNVGLVGWRQQPESEKNIKEDLFIISSGCLSNVGALQRCGGFDEQLFIDHVDTDINIKIKNLGYKTFTAAIKVVHQLGTKTEYKTIRGKIYHAHSPVRVYYIIRNGIVLFKRYFLNNPSWALWAIKTSFREGMYLVIYQPNKFKNLFIIAKAWKDGLLNKLGKFQ